MRASFENKRKKYMYKTLGPQWVFFFLHRFPHAVFSSQFHLDVTEIEKM